MTVSDGGSGFLPDGQVEFVGLEVLVEQVSASVGVSEHALCVAHAEQHWVRPATTKPTSD